MFLEVREQTSRIISNTLHKSPLATNHEGYLSADDKAPSYMHDKASSYMHGEFLENHSRLIHTHGPEEQRIAEEYEPFVYSDDVTLDYHLEGLKNISVQEEGSFALNTSGAVRPRSRIEFVRVQFYGVAILTPQIWIGDAEGIWTARFNITHPGLYRVHIKSVRRPSRTDHSYRAVRGSPFTLLVRPADSDHLTAEEILAAMPVPESPAGPLPVIGRVRYPPAPCREARWRPGRWLRCHHTPEPCVRSG
jgi:hypothetical protein